MPLSSAVPVRGTGPLRDRRRLVGAAAAVAVLVLVTLGWLKPNPFASQRTVRAEFADASGLAAIGADVRVAGTPVGKVTGKRRVGDHAELTLEIDPDVDVRRNATAETRPRLMFEGTAYVELHPGTRAAPALGDARLPLDRTRTYVPLSDALDVLAARARANLRGGGHELARALAPGTPAHLQHLLRTAPALLDDAGSVARAARGTHGTELRRAVGHLATTTEAIASRASDLGPATAAAADTTTALTTASGAALDASLARLPGTIARVETTASDMRAVLARLTPLATRLRPTVRDLAPTLDAVRPLMRTATPVARDAAPLIADLESGVAGTAGGADDIRATLIALAPTASVARRSLLPALEKDTALGIPAYQAFLNLFAGGGGASRPFGVNGDGHFMRFGLRFLTGAGQPLPPCSLVEQLNAQIATQLSQAGACTP